MSSNKSGPVRPLKPVVAQLKTHVSAQSIKRPVAPPVYRPQPLPKVLQKKSALVGPPKVAQAPLRTGPPVYRPQPIPKVLQKKTAANAQKNVPVVARPPVAPRADNLKTPNSMQMKQAANQPKPPFASTRRPQFGQRTNSSLPNQRNVTQMKPATKPVPRNPNSKAVIQRMIGFEYEVEAIRTQKNSSWIKRFAGAWTDHPKGEVIMNRSGYSITADVNMAGDSNIEFITPPIDETVPANITRLRQVARDIAADLLAIYNGSMASTDPDDWVGADQIPRLRGWWWHRFQSRTNNWHNVNGQLQMTGGVRLNRLPRVLSGSALGQEPVGQVGAAEVKRRTLTRFYQSDPAATPKQPVYRRALAEINPRFAHRAQWHPPVAREILASVVALMAQIPIDKRGGFPPDNSAILLTKTNYSKILHMLVTRYRAPIDEGDFRAALVATINAFLPAVDHVTADSDVFPAYFVSNGVTLGGLTIRQWVEWVIPEVDPVAGSLGELDFLQGIDKVTSKDFPGTRPQQKELRAFGTYGDKTDAGNKIILEFRNFTNSVPADLENAMVGAAEYLRTDVNG